MWENSNKQLLLKTFVLGLFIAILVYCFHPDTGQFSLTVNGEPVAEPLVRFAAIPTLFIAIVITAILMLLAFFGVGLLIFLMVLGVSMIGIFIIAPYFWPVLLIVFLVILFSSLGNSSKFSE